jgi:hypothetical protein
MDAASSGETGKELLGLAQARGYPVSARQLAYWHRKGLIPRPVQRSLGKGHGTESVYPPGTGEQLLALCEAHSGEKRLDHVAWRLWWEDHEVSFGLLREFLVRVAAEVDGWMQELRDQETGQLSGSAWNRLDDAPEERLSKPLSRARKRVSRRRFDTFMRVLFEVVTGGFEGFGSEEPEADRRVMEKGLGLERARTDRLPNVEPWLKTDIATILRDVSRQLFGLSLSEELANLEDEQLLEARDEARSWMEVLDRFSRVLERAFGRGAFGLSGMVEAIREMGAQEQALWTLMWAVSRFRGPASLREGLEAHGKPTPEMWAGLRDWETFSQTVEELREEVPALASALAMRQIVGALLDSRKMEAHTARLRELSEEHGDELRAFSRAHPDARRVLGAPEPKDDNG